MSRSNIIRWSLTQTLSAPATSAARACSRTPGCRASGPTLAMIAPKRILDSSTRARWAAAADPQRPGGVLDRLLRLDDSTEDLREVHEPALLGVRDDRPPRVA